MNIYYVDVKRVDAVGNYHALVDGRKVDSLDAGYKILAYHKALPAASLCYARTDTLGVTRQSFYPEYQLTLSIIQPDDTLIVEDIAYADAYHLGGIENERVL